MNNNKTKNLLKIMACAVLLISMILYKVFFLNREDYTVEDLNEYISENMNLESFQNVDGEPDQEASDTEVIEIGIYFSQKSYKYLDLLTYEENKVILNEIREYMEDESIGRGEISIVDDTFRLGKKEASFTVVIEAGEMLSIKFNRATQVLQINME